MHSRAKLTNWHDKVQTTATLKAAMMRRPLLTTKIAGSLMASMVMLLMCVPGVSRAAGIEAAPKTFVEDHAGVIGAGTRQKLIGMLQELEQKTLTRVIVLTVTTTGGMDIHQYAFERADKWKFGANRKSASVLVVVAVKDRDYRIEVGYETEGIITDSIAGRIGRDSFVPFFKANRYGDGILAGTVAIAQEIARARGKTLSGVPDLPQVPRGNMRGFGSFLPVIILILIFVSGGRRGRSMLFWGMIGGSMLGRSGRHGGGGFGGGGGGFGSFGGGGGGGFGGGGASGSW